MDDASLALYQNGSQALKQARYEDAIACLERFCKETVNRQSKQFFQAQMWLIQAYHKDQKDLHAIALCEQLVKSDVPQVKQWADNALNKLMATTEAVTDAPPSPATVPPSEASSTAAPPPVSASETAELPPVDEVPVITPPIDAPPVDAAPAGEFTRKPLPASQVSRPRSTYSRSRSTTKSQPKDYTRQIMSAIAHGSISMLASFLIYLLFSDSFVANGLGLLRFAVPLLIFFTTQDALVKNNAREALNYAITCLILIIPLIVAFFALALIVALLPPIGLLLGAALVGYLVVLSFYPVVGTILCLVQEDYEFRYPNWLILHLI